MKVKFYCDIIAGSYPRHPLFANTDPGTKTESIPRLMFEVEIPDRLISGYTDASPETVSVKQIHDQLGDMK